MNPTNPVFERFVQAEEEHYPILREEFSKGGYSMFSELLDGLRYYLTMAAEDELEKTKLIIEKGKTIIPDPGALSPSWERVWADHEAYVTYKAQALAAMPRDMRDGEWQIVMDNPFTNEGIACYPALSFVEAAYLYAYFRKDLKKNEYIRLQKVVSLLQVEGGSA